MRIPLLFGLLSSFTLLATSYNAVVTVYGFVNYARPMNGYLPKFIGNTIIKTGPNSFISRAATSLRAFGCCHGATALHTKQPFASKCCRFTAVPQERSTIKSILDVFNQKDTSAEYAASQAGGASSDVMQLPKTVTLMGWVQNVRSIQNGNVLFIDLNDGSSSGNIQLVVDSKISNFEEIAKIERGDGIRVIGSLERRRGRPTDKSHSDVDVYVDNASKGHCIQLYANAKPEGGNPVDLANNYSLEHLRRLPHLRSRKKTIASIFRIRGELLEHAHKFFSKNGFTCTTTPCLTGVNCEGMGDLFQVISQTFESQDSSIEESQKQYTFLSVSGQLELEALCCSLGNVWKLGPSFRADRSDTTRHLAEFLMLEAEAIGVDLKYLITLIHEYIKSCARTLLKNCMDDVEYLNVHLNTDLKSQLEKLSNVTMAIISYCDAVELLNGLEGYEHPKINFGDQLGIAHEKSLVKHFGDSLVALTHFPESYAPFYMKSMGDGTVENVDILVPTVLEIAGGSIREDRLDVLEKKIKEKNIQGPEYDQYLDLRRYGNIPHGGFGIGFDRLVMLLTGAKNIRDVVPFPKVKSKAGVA